MSWGLGAGAVLVVTLAAGFAWYERTRPTTRMVALVASLAALGALGRIAFAPLPNVKPTTDIVLVAGYALGGGPGFVVGALSALTSNFFFGQGPWTPWQMAGWGLTGLLGAGLAPLTGRRLSRWGLAAACGATGFLFTVMQDAGDWVNFSDHSPRALGVYVGKGLGFDAVHAAGCVAFALLLGTAFSRSLERFARRATFEWEPDPAGPDPAGPDPAARTGPPTVFPAGGTSAALLVAAIALLLISPGRARAAGPSDPAGAAAMYLVTAQNRDGGFGSSVGSPSESLFTGWAAMGLASDGLYGVDLAPAGTTLPTFLEKAGRAAGADTGALERTILAVAATAAPAAPTLIAALRARIGHTGAVAGQVNLTAFAILALRAAGDRAPPRTLVWLARQQNRDGGFGYAAAPSQSDVDDTGAALEALRAAPARTVARAVAFIRRAQNADGGFPSQPGQRSNAQSTAWAVQGLLAAGVDPDAIARAGSRTPLRYLAGLVAPDGHVRYDAGTDQTPVWVTAEALMALLRRPLPILQPSPGTPAGEAALLRSAIVGRCVAVARGALALG